MLANQIFKPEAGKTLNVGNISSTRHAITRLTWTRTKTSNKIHEKVWKLRLRWCQTTQQKTWRVKLLKKIFRGNCHDTMVANFLLLCISLSNSVMSWTIVSISGPTQSLLHLQDLLCVGFRNSLFSPLHRCSCRYFRWLTQQTVWGQAPLQLPQ